MAKAKSQSSSTEDTNFFSKIINMLLGGLDPGHEKKRLLKGIKKNLKRTKIKFFKPAGDIAMPGAAKFFYDLYRVVGPAQVLLENADSSSALKSILIESYFNDVQRDIFIKLQEENLRTRAEEVDIKVLADEVKDEIIDFFSGFDLPKVKEINSIFNKTLSFIDFTRFDFYFLLKKFDSGLPERDFNYNPRFENISGEYITEDLKDFLVLIPFIEPDPLWETVFDVLKEYKGLEVVNRGEWNKNVKTLSAIKKSRIIEMIIQHLDKDPYYKVSSEYHDERIVENYLQDLKTKTENTINRLMQEQKNARKSKLLNMIFGTSAVARTKYYTEKNNMAFTRKSKGFIYIEPVNFLKAFLLDFFKKDVKELVDLLLIRGKWTSNVLSQQLSESFYKTMDLSQKIVEFDESLADEGPLGAKLKAAALRAERDKTANHILVTTLDDVNNRAKDIINASAQNLISIGKNFKSVMEDYKANNKELIINWKEVESAVGTPIPVLIGDVYKKMYYLVQLLQSFMKNVD